MEPITTPSLEEQKKQIEKKIEEAKHHLWLLDVDLKAVNKKIAREKEMQGK